MARQGLATPAGSVSRSRCSPFMETVLTFQGPSIPSARSGATVSRSGRRCRAASWSHGARVVCTRRTTPRAPQLLRLGLWLSLRCRAVAGVGIARRAMAVRVRRQRLSVRCRSPGGPEAGTRHDVSDPVDAAAQRGADASAFEPGHGLPADTADLGMGDVVAPPPSLEPTPAQRDPNGAAGPPVRLRLGHPPFEPAGGQTSDPAGAGGRQAVG